MQGHIFKLLGGWLQEHTHIRDDLVTTRDLTVDACRRAVHNMQQAVDAVGRDHPVPKLSERKLARLAKEAAIAEAKAEQDRESAALAALEQEASGKVGNKYDANATEGRLLACANGAPHAAAHEGNALLRQACSHALQHGGDNVADNVARGGPDTASWKLQDSAIAADAATAPAAAAAVGSAAMAAQQQSDIAQHSDQAADTVCNDRHVAVAGQLDEVGRQQDGEAAGQNHDRPAKLARKLTASGSAIAQT